MAMDFMIPAPSAAARKVPILAYRELDVADKQWSVNTPRPRAQLGCLCINGYMLVTASELFTGLKNRDSLPSRRVVLTIDGGLAPKPAFGALLKVFGFVGTYAVPSSPAVADRELTNFLVGSRELCGYDSARMTTGRRSVGSEVGAIEGKSRLGTTNWR